MLETVKVWRADLKRFKIINACDFDPNIHTLCEPDPVDEVKPAKKTKAKVG